jgi:hypothetical protein
VLTCGMLGWVLEACPGPRGRQGHLFQAKEMLKSTSIVEIKGLGIVFG